MKRVLNYVLLGWPEKSSDDIKSYRQKQYELTVEDGCLMWGHRVVIPQVLREKLLQELHDAHMGVVRMKCLARSYIWWPGLDRDIESLAKKCETCLQNASNPPRANLHVWDWPDGPNERIHVDFLGPINNRMFMTIIDDK